MKRCLSILCLALSGVVVLAGMGAAQDVEGPMVAEGSTVTIDYKLVVGDVLVESSDTGGPLVFTVGTHQVVPGLERAVIGMRVGEQKTFTLEPEEGYGRATEPVREVPIDELPPGITPEERMVLFVEDEIGRQRFITIVEVKEKSVVVDFNHPLAGKQLQFEVEVLKIETPR